MTEQIVKKKAVAKIKNNGMIKTGSERMAEYTAIGKLNTLPLEKEFGKLRTDEVILTDERVSHIIERHADDYKYFKQHCSDAVTSPDYIIKDLKNENTVFMIKKVEETNFNVVVKLALTNDDSAEGLLNSVMTSYRIRDKNLHKLCQKNKTLYINE